MATSSIFHNVVITDPKKADAFIAAIEESIADPYKRPEGPLNKVNTDPAVSRRLAEMRRRARVNK